MRFPMIALALASAGAMASTPSSASTRQSIQADTGAVQLTEDDIADRSYHVLGDLKVVVRKQTLLSAEPTRERVNKKLKKAARKLGADAVILIRYGTVGMGVIGWGELEGRGRAIRFD